MAADLVKLVVSLSLIALCLWLSGCPAPGANGYPSPNEQRSLILDQELSDWQMRMRQIDLEMRVDELEQQLDDEGGEDE